MGTPLTPSGETDIDPLSGRTTPTFSNAPLLTPTSSGFGSVSVKEMDAKNLKSVKGSAYGYGHGASAFDDCDPNEMMPPPPAYRRS